jgi:hypothetical protein
VFRVLGVHRGFREVNWRLGKQEVQGTFPVSYRIPIGMKLSANVDAGHWRLLIANCRLRVPIDYWSFAHSQIGDRQSSAMLTVASPDLSEQSVFATGQLAIGNRQSPMTLRFFRGKVALVNLVDYF